MKNTHILPNTEVPIELRKEVYREAFNVIDEKKDVYGMEKCYPLCVLLPCILWGLSYFLDLAPNKEDWDYKHTDNMFPELKSFIKQRKHIDDQTRLKFLKSVI